MSGLVCYVAIDNIYLKEQLHVYKNIDQECLSKNSKRIGGDGPSGEKSGLVVGLNHYDNLVYKMHIESLKPGEYSECDGPDATRALFHYYETSEEVLEDCIIKAGSNMNKTFIAGVIVGVITIVGVGIYNYYNSIPIVHAIPIPEDINLPVAIVAVRKLPALVEPAVVNEDDNLSFLGVITATEIHTQVTLYNCDE